MDYRERARKRATERRTSIWYKLAEGDNTFRILPTPASDTTDGVFIEYRMHRDVGPKKARIRCGIDVSDEGKCWICDVLIPKLKKSGKGVRATALAPRDECAIQICKVDSDGSMTGPFIWTPSKTVADQLIASVFGSKKRDYVDGKKGYNLTINRTGTGKNDTRYGIIEPDSDPSRVPAEILKKLKPFSELKEIPVYNEGAQKAAYTGQDATEEPEEEEESDEAAVEEDDVVEDEEEEAPPVTKKPAKVTKPAVEEPEEEPEEEEEEKPKPAAKKSGKVAKPAPEPEEEDDIEEEDAEDITLDDLEEDDAEEEEKPAPVAKKKKPPVVVEEPEEEDDEEETPPPPPVKKKVKK